MAAASGPKISRSLEVCSLLSAEAIEAIASAGTSSIAQHTIQACAETFCTLPIAHQAAALVSNAAAAHKFPAHIATSLRSAAVDGLPKLLAGDASLIPPCPSFLYTSEPGLPWAPTLCSPETAAAVLAKERSRTHYQHAKRHSDKVLADDNDGITHSASKRAKREAVSTLSTLSSAIKSVVVEIENATNNNYQAAEISEACKEALDTVLRHHEESSLSQPAVMTLPLLSHDAVLLMIRAAVSETSSATRVSAAANLLVLPALRALDEPPTQSLHAVIDHLGSTNSRALVEGCIVPLLSASGSSSINKHTAELLTKAIKSGIIAVEVLPDVLQVQCSREASWSDHVVAIIQSILDTKPQLDAAAMAGLVTAVFSAASGPLRGSVKLAKLLLALVKGWGRQMDASVIENAKAAARACGTFMQKPTLTALDSLAG